MRATAPPQVLNTVPAEMDIPKLMGALAPGGTLVQIGMPGGGAAMRVPLLGLVCGQKRVVGSIVGGRSDMQACALERTVSLKALFRSKTRTPPLRRPAVRHK